MEDTNFIKNITSKDIKLSHSIIENIIKTSNIEAFRQYEVLSDFFERQGVSLISLGDSPLFDYGGAVSFFV